MGHISESALTVLIPARAEGHLPEVRRDRFAGYGLSLGLPGHLDLSGLLLLPGHAITLIALCGQGSACHGPQVLGILDFGPCALMGG
jgi:hypothetical protein